MWQPIRILAITGSDDSVDKIPPEIAPLLVDEHVESVGKSSHGMKKVRKVKIEAQRRTASLKEARIKPTQVAQGSPPSNQLPRAISSHDCPYAAGSNPASAYELFCNVLMPAWYRRPTFQTQGVDKDFLGDIATFITQDSLVLEASLIPSLLFHKTIQSGMAKPDAEILHFQSKQIQRILTALSTSDYSNQVIWILFSLMGQMGILGNLEKLNIHFKGMQEMFASRPASSNPAFDRYLDNVFISFQEHNRASQILKSREVQGNTCLGRFEYLTVPCDRDGKRLLSTLPGGIAELGLSGVLSLPLLRLAARMVAWKRWVKIKQASARALDRANRLSAAMCLRLWQTTPLSMAERLFVIGCITYCILNGRDMETWWATQAYVQASCLALNMVPLAPSHDQPALMVWTARVLQVTFGKDNPPWTLAGRLLAYVAVNHPLFKKQHERTVQNFFWDL